MAGEATARALIEIRRRISADQSARYDEVWLDLRSRVEALSSHAWRFRLREDPVVFVEFIEYRAAADPRDEPSVRIVLETLDRISTGSVETFIDAPATIQKGRG